MTVTGRTIRHAEAEALQGGRAGFVSRVLADGVDFLVVEVLFLAILLGIGVVRFLVSRKDFAVGAPDVWVTVVGQWLLTVVYLGTNWSSTGRTVGKSVLGLRVERAGGGPVEPWRAFLRAAACASFWASLLWIFVSRRNAALHDVVFATQVVYDWRGTGPRPSHPTRRVSS
jgi:uncharacterized RDD family membrane protein YckC